MEYFNNNNKFIFFVVFNIVFFTLAISIYPGLALASGFFAMCLLTNMSIIYLISRKEGLFKSWWAVVLYPITYGIFGYLKFLPLDFPFMLLMAFAIHCQIKVYPYLFLEHQDNMLEVWNYAFLDDFDKGMSLHKYGIPLSHNINETRLIDEEIKLMRAFNQALFFKNKITEKNFGEIGNLHFYVPKSLSLVVYQAIINYCDLGVKSQSNNPITIKVRDYTDQQFNIGRGDYMLEFRIDQENLKSNTEKDGRKTVLSDAINEIHNVCRHKEMSIYGIEHGISADDKKYYLIRIKYKKPDMVDPKIVAALNSTNIAHVLANNTIMSKQTEYEKVN